jgi:hypothetical protein
MLAQGEGSNQKRQQSGIDDTFQDVVANRQGGQTALAELFVKGDHEDQPYECRRWSQGSLLNRLLGF